MSLPELLAPAGNHEKLVTALHYGADAVYLGLSGFSLRAKAENFSQDNLKSAVELVHNQGRKIYITVNIFPHNRDISSIREHIIALNKLTPDGIIVSDPGIFEMASEMAPNIPVHVSTQANITSFSGARFWERLGAKRLILSRELTIYEIMEIRDKVSIELECFVHGAICMSYSGRCYISSFLTNRSANRGECTNSCRWNYRLMEEKRDGVYHPVYEDDRGTYVMSSKDLCMIEHLDKLADAGVNSFKLEGRMKGINYLAGVVKTYREALDSLRFRPYKINGDWLRELSMFSSRGYTTGMFLGPHPDDGYNHDEEKIYKMSHELVGVVRAVNNGNALVALRNNLKAGDHIEFLSKGLENRTFEVKRLADEHGRPLDTGRNEDLVLLDAAPGLRSNDIIRRPLRQALPDD